MFPEEGTAHDSSVVNKEGKGAFRPAFPRGLGDGGTVCKIHGAGDGPGAKRSDFAGNALESGSVHVPQDHHCGAFARGT
ncbi:hypothetical protein D9M72_614870 [compost metagenome]